MNILHRQDPEPAKGNLSELWSLYDLYTLEITESERRSNIDMNSNPDAILRTKTEPPLLYMSRNFFLWPSLSQPITTSSLLSSYPTQTPTLYIPTGTDLLRKQRQLKEKQPQKRAEDKSDEPESKIRCWNHSCDGRRFSSMSNYRRHLREKGGNVKRHQCKDCGRSFTRSTSRNTHRLLGTCWKRKATT